MFPKNIKIKKTRGRPKKEKSETESESKNETNTIPEFLLPPLPPTGEEEEENSEFCNGLSVEQYTGITEEIYNSDDKIRTPDKTFNECLIPPDDEYDDDNILNQLRNSINDSSVYPPDNELQFALEMSIKENPHYSDNLKELNEMLVLSKLEFEEHLKNKKGERKRVLSNFYRKLHFLNFPYIIEQLNEYFHCNIDIIYLDSEIHKNIFNIIDSYYKIPNEKGRKCAITEEEDNMLRAILFIKD